MNFFAPFTWLGRTALTGLQAAGSALGKGASAATKGATGLARNAKNWPGRMEMGGEESLLRTPDFNPYAMPSVGTPRVPLGGEGVPVLPAVRSAAPAPDAPYLTRDPAIAGRGLTRREAAPIAEPEVAGMDWGISPNHRVTPSGTASEKLFRRDVNAPFNPEYDSVEGGRRGAIVERYERAMEPGGKLKLALQNAGLGALQAISTNWQNNPRASAGELLASGAAGAGVGGIGTAINPARGAQFQTDLTVTPELQRQETRRQALEDRNAIVRRRRTDEENVRGQMEDRRADNEYRRDTLKRQQDNDRYQRQKDVRDYGLDQRRLDLNERQLDLQEEGNYYDRERMRGGGAGGRLSSADEKMIENQAEILAAEAFGPAESSDILRQYADQAFQKRTARGTGKVKTLDKLTGQTVEADDPDIIARMRTESEAEAKEQYSREYAKWKNKFHNYLRDFGPPRRGTEMKPNQVEAFARANGFSNVEDAKRFLRTLGYGIR